MEGDKLNTTAEVSDGGTRSLVLIKFGCFFAVMWQGSSKGNPRSIIKAWLTPHIGAVLIHPFPNF